MSMNLVRDLDVIDYSALKARSQFVRRLSISSYVAITQPPMTPRDH